MCICITAWERGLWTRRDPHVVYQFERDQDERVTDCVRKLGTFDDRSSALKFIWSQGGGELEDYFLLRASDGQGDGVPRRL